MVKGFSKTVNRERKKHVATKHVATWNKLDLSIRQSPSFASVK